MARRNNSLAAQILETLEEQGYRATFPRQAVVNAVAYQDKHFTAEEIRQQLPKVGRATIYRSLKMLVETGILCRVMLEEGNLHYQLSHHGHHHHLLCVECGASQDLMGCDIEDVLTTVTAAHDFQISSHWLEVYGRCRNCTQKAQTAA